MAIAPYGGFPSDNSVALNEPINRKLNESFLKTHVNSDMNCYSIRLIKSLRDEPDARCSYISHGQRSQCADLSELLHENQRCGITDVKILYEYSVYGIICEETCRISAGGCRWPKYRATGFFCAIFLEYPKRKWEVEMESHRIIQVEERSV